MIEKIANKSRHESEISTSRRFDKSKTDDFLQHVKVPHVTVKLKFLSPKIESLSVLGEF